MSAIESPFECPDCGEQIAGMIQALQHCSALHSDLHPGMEPAAVAIAYRIEWSKDEYDEIADD